ncbi:MauE/DoxX family redox-associated membrane protein [Pseudoclavibacter helvolus]|uniref:MauE/DoxX family redox-associated membrane protein n=1 Tax=Pseudoclavibacter helvolus TaxID=255205 RepID=UPI003C716F51
MLPTFVIFPVLVACVLIASGALKLPQRSRTLQSFASFGLPAALRKPWTAVALPVGEIVLGAALLLLSGPTYLVAAALAALLMAAYLAVVARSVAKRQAVDCNCFGALSTEPVSQVTIWRNAGLTLAALFALLLPGMSLGVPAQLALFSLGDWTWLVAIAMVALVGIVASLVKTPAAPASSPASATPGQDFELVDQSPDLISDPSARDMIPHNLELVSGDGSPELLYNLVVIPQKTTILIFARVGCGSCGPVLSQIGDWSRRLGDNAQIIVATSSSRASVKKSYPGALPSTYFGAKAVTEYFEAEATPAALLLAADGTIASAPEYGSEIITERIEQLLASFDAQREAQPQG